MASRNLRLPLILVCAGGWWCLVACSLEKAPLKTIRGHVLDLGRVVHANGLFQGERYCQECHGTYLEGGLNDEPSCYRCHGRNWLATGPDASLAPADHSVVNDKYHHHSQYQSPEGTCAVSGCHGATLQGDITARTPGCYTCHGQVW